MIDKLAQAARGVALAGALRLSALVEPMPAPRPRFTRTGFAFQPKDYQIFMAKLLDVYLRALPVGDPFEGPCLVALEFVRARPKTTKLYTPRGDLDNLCKGVLDAATKTGRIWKDDAQIVAISATKRWSRPGEAAAVHMTVLPLDVGECQ